MATSEWRIRTRLNPTETPIDTTWEDRAIDWCDGKGEHPGPPPADQIGGKE